MTETTHDLKVFPGFWPALLSGEKNFELRYDDRGYRAGDILLLREWTKLTGYSGNELRKRVTYVVAGRPWLADGYVCMGLRDLKEALKDPSRVDPDGRPRITTQLLRRPRSV